MSFTGVNPTEVLRYIKRLLGDCVYDISDEMSDDEIMRIVFEESLVTYSRYFPYRFRVIVSEKDRVVTGSSNCYKLPNIEGIKINGVTKCMIGNYYNYNINAMPITTNPFNSQLMADYRSMTSTPATWHFIPPNHVEINPQLLTHESALLEVRAVHPTHLNTIPLTMKDYFCRLAYLDVLESLKPYRKRYQSIQTPYGNIELLLDDIENAHSEKAALLDKFQEKHLLQSASLKIFSA